MSGSVAGRKRLIRLGEPDLRAGIVRLDGHSDFFRRVGSADRGASADWSLSLEGMGDAEGVELIFGDDGAELVLRGGDIPRFLAKRELRVGDVLALERRGRDRYALSVFESKRDREYDWTRWLREPLPGAGPTALELFAGCGGMALGFKRAGFRTALAVEWDAAACDSLEANVTERVARCAIQEVETFPKVDVVAGGPPCQGFSNLGEKVPDDPRNQLWAQYLRAVEQARPVAFVMENVPPLLASEEFLRFRRAAERLGYGVDGRVLNAADYGVPQTRKRAIVIGRLGGPPDFPEPTHVSPERRDAPTARTPDWLTVRDAIFDLPREPDGRNWHVGRNPTATSLERYRHVPPGGNRWNLPPELTPDCWKRKTTGGTDLFGRLWWDRPSVTIRTEFYKPEKGRYLHPEAHRPITHREAARLQGFPDDFAFRGSRIQVGVQIGNACPPPLAFALARHLRERLPLWAERRSDRQRIRTR